MYIIFFHIASQCTTKLFFLNHLLQSTVVGLVIDTSRQQGRVPRNIFLNRLFRVLTGTGRIVFGLQNCMVIMFKVVY